MQKLLNYYSAEGPERCGLILNDGTIIETVNNCASPNEGFSIPTEDLLKYEETMVASWHTHPGQDSNLSVEDYIGILNWPNLTHYVIGSDGLATYTVQDGNIINGA